MLHGANLGSVFLVTHTLERPLHGRKCEAVKDLSFLVSQMKVLLDDHEYRTFYHSDSAEGRVAHE